jgi:hypothetical protein
MGGRRKREKVYDRLYFWVRIWEKELPTPQMNVRDVEILMWEDSSIGNGKIWDPQNQSGKAFEGGITKIN